MTVWRKEIYLVYLFKKCTVLKIKTEETLLTLKHYADGFFKDKFGLLRVVTSQVLCWVNFFFFKDCLVG